MAGKMARSEMSGGQVVDAAHLEHWTRRKVGGQRPSDEPWCQLNLVFRLRR